MHNRLEAVAVSAMAVQEAVFGQHGHGRRSALGDSLQTLMRKGRNMAVRKKLTAAVVTASALTSVGLALPTAAHASTHTASWRENNYQLAFQDVQHNTSHVCVGGVSQRDKWTGRCWDTLREKNPFSGWYWHGCIHLIGYNRNYSRVRWDAWFDIDRYARAQSARNGEFVWYVNDGQLDGC